jgi:hypothetical protein
MRSTVAFPPFEWPTSISSGDPSLRTPGERTVPRWESESWDEAAAAISILLVGGWPLKDVIDPDR